MEQVIAGAIGLGYAGVLAGMWYLRGSVPAWLKPLGIVLVPSLLAWSAFYGLTFVLDAGEQREFFVAISRMAHSLDLAFLYVLLALVAASRKK